MLSNSKIKLFHIIFMPKENDNFAILSSFKTKKKCVSSFENI